jgi:thiol-disulfide isomerase/thioredoxin
MKTPPTTNRIMLGVACLAVVSLVPPAAAQDPGGGSKAYSSLADLEASYERQLTDLERRKLADLVVLAGRLNGIEAESAFRAAFDLSVARGLYAEAEPSARAYLARKKGEPETQALAASVILVAHAERGEFERSLAELKQFLDSRAAAPVPDDRRLPGALICAVGEAYLQRLIRGGRFDIARQVCHLALNNTHPDKVVQTYFTERLARLDLVGKLAPAIEGTDVDGRTVRLADLKGKVVLVDFWATWCPPCVASFPQIRELNLAHRDQGFAVLGINLDLLAQDASGKQANAKEVLSAVRWFLLEHLASWPNVIGPGAEAAAKAYGVNEVPASFLVGRDGTILQVELSGKALSQAVTQALKGPAAADPK